MTNQALISGYYSYIKFERNFTDNSATAYMSDIAKLERHAAQAGLGLADLRTADIEEFLAGLHDVGIAPESQARILAGIKSFYHYLVLDGTRADDPTELIPGPRRSSKLPTVLTLDEVNAIVEAPDADSPLGQLDRAILETLYSCGLRVSELIGLRFSRIYAADGYILVEGKGRKQRIVPIAPSALAEIERYRDGARADLRVAPGDEDVVFLNWRGRHMSRVAVFDIVKQYSAAAGVRKVISPHTFRHTFATHPLEGGANLRAIQMMLGHESITTTQLYMHVDTQQLREEIHPRNMVHKD